LKHYFPIITAALFSISGCAFTALADWINLTGAQSAPNIAEIHVNDDHVKLVLEVYVNDLDKFVDLLPDEFFKKGGMPAVSLDFIAYHKGVPVVDYRYLSEAAKMHLNWEDPWYSRRGLPKWRWMNH
jgi:hypothetical protein